jgi:hypothetical protein
MYAQRFGQETPIPSMQLCIENVDQAGGCAYGYACVYTDSISWASATEPLPGHPRSARGVREAVRRRGLARRAREPSPHAAQHPRLRRHRDDVDEADVRRRRIAARATATSRTSRGGAPPAADRGAQLERRAARLPGAPAGVPDSFAEHVQLMFDLQVLAFSADITRVFSFKMGRDGSSRVYPESGSDKPFHPASHHGGNEKGVKEFHLINKYHVAMLPYFLDKLKSVQEGESTCWTRRSSCTARRWATRTCTTIVAARSSCSAARTGSSTGNTHIKAPDGTPMANALLTVAHTLGMDDMKTLGDSTGTLSVAANA